MMDHVEPREHDDSLDNLPMWARDLAGHLRNGARLQVPLNGEFVSLTPEYCRLIVATMEAVSEHDRRVTELLEANNRYQQEARAARAMARDSFKAVAAINKLLLNKMKETTDDLASS